MASLSMSEGWTPKQNKLFEQVMAVHERDTPDRWHNIARAIGGGKSADDVRRYYELLVHDVARIEVGKVLFPAYRPPCPGPGHNPSYEADRYTTQIHYTDGFNEEACAYMVLGGTL
ncbi:protein RADIALIS-like 3 [Hordeum vulgare subsp. vulgare]|uniref:protein RADIALIS-like 3 n=1 Tax=Hordeum vulgare subsp. vulgare TaxID=112509 RepID=UPI001D1A32B8|nr:protein RADIALIS-like 3 [Hordeum vulgare subsp. vulgare]